MENQSSSYGFTSTWLRDDDPLYPCDWVAREDKRRCYQMVTFRILPAVGDDWDETASRLLAGRGRVSLHVLPLTGLVRVEPLEPGRREDGRDLLRRSAIRRRGRVHLRGGARHRVELHVEVSAEPRCARSSRRSCLPPASPASGRLRGDSARRSPRVKETAGRSRPSNASLLLACAVCTARCPEARARSSTLARGRGGRRR